MRAWIAPYHSKYVQQRDNGYEVVFHSASELHVTNE